MKKHLFLILIFIGILVQKPFAQNFPWVDTTYAIATPTLGPIGYGICTDDSDNVFVTGDESTYIIFSLKKYKPNGVLEWADSGYAYNAVAADHWGNCYATGNYFFAKYNSTGRLIHKDSVRIGSSGISFIGNTISYDGGKYLYIAGDFAQASGATAIFGTKSITLGTNPVGFILKCDTVGNVIWAKSGTSIHPSSSEFTPLGINANPKGGIYVTGYFSDTVLVGADSLKSAESKTVGFIACYDSGGNVKWVHSINRYNSECTAISSDGAGNAYFTGAAGYNCFIAKCRSNGDSIWWNECNGGPNLESLGYGIATNSSGISFITGFYSGAPFGTITLHYGGSDLDIFIVKYDSSGNAVWGYDPNDTLPNSVWNIGCSVAIGNNLNLGCNYYFTGVTQTPAKFKSYIDLSQESEFYVTELKNGCNVSSVETETLSKEIVNVYPNPFTNSTTILFNESGKHQLELTDITGRIINEYECTGQQYELQRGALASGMYFIKVTDEQKNISVSKILVQ